MKTDSSKKPSAAASTTPAATTESLNDLVGETYEELRHIARTYYRNYRNASTMTTTALVSEAYLVLAAQRTGWDQNVPGAEERLKGLAAVTMRRLLVSNIRRHRAQKRIQDDNKVSFSDVNYLLADHAMTPEQIVSLDDALENLEALDPRAAKLVTFRVFAGMSNGEIAEALDISLATVKRDWTFAKAWLRNALTP